MSHVEGSRASGQVPSGAVGRRAVRRFAMRRLALGAMVLVTSWSIWTWAQQPPTPRRPAPPPPPAQPASSPIGRGPAERPTPPMPSPPRGPEGAHEGPRAEGPGEAKKETEHDEAPPPMNWTEFGSETPPFIAMLINFGILAAGYYLLGKKPIAAGLQARSAAIGKEIQEAQRMKEEAEERAKTYQAKLQRLEADVTTAREALVRAGEAERDRILQEAEASGARMQRDAQFQVEQEMKQIRQDLTRETVEAAVTAAEALLKRSLTPADHERLAEQYLNDLERMGREPAARSSSDPGDRITATGAES